MGVPISLTPSVGDGSTTVFTAAQVPVNPILFLDGLKQQAGGVHFSWTTGTVTFTFTSPPPAGSVPELLADASTPIPAGPTDGSAGGPSSLASLRTRIRQESDTENDGHIQDTELTTWINQSRFRLYAKLVTSFGDDYFNAKAQITTDGVNTEFAMPNGALYSAAPAFFKGALVELISGYGATTSRPIPLKRLNLREKNRFSQPFGVAIPPTVYPRYRIMGETLLLWPLPTSGLVVQLWYAPKLTPLAADSDVADDWSGWLELVVVDCCIKVLAKQERDASIFIARKAELVAEIDAEKANRDLGEPNTVQMTEEVGFPPFGGMGGVGGAWS